MNTYRKYSPEELLCGIDGGGTTTRVVVCDRAGEILYSFSVGSINHYGAGVSTARENFRVISSRLSSYFGCLPGIIFAGNSALSREVSEESAQELSGSVFGASKIFFHSDVYIALLAFTLGRPGAVIIAGTGSMACGIDMNGSYHTAGGWGQILGDEGSAYHIAQEGMKAALRAHDGVSMPTQLTARLVSHFHLNEITEIIDKIYEPPVQKSVIAAFATEVEQAAGEGDCVAIEILEREAESLHKLALAICRRCNTRNLGYSGSVLTTNRMILSALRARLQKDDISLNEPLLSPEAGALIAAFREAQIPINQTVIDNLPKYKP